MELSLFIFVVLIEIIFILFSHSDIKQIIIVKIFNYYELSYKLSYKLLNILIQKFIISIFLV
jgi:hypothetical protein